MSAFDDATVVTQRPDGSVYDVSIHPDWTIGDKPNGGYLTALMVRASVHSLQLRGALHTDPMAASATFLRAPGVGDATVRVDVLRAGRTASQVRATLTQNDTPCVDVVAVIGQLDDEGAPRWSSPPPDIADHAACMRLPAERPGMPVRVSILDVTDVRLDPASAQAVTGDGGGEPDLRGWMGFTDGRPHDALSLLYTVDCFPPATFALGSAGWVPTLQLSAYVRARPAPGPLRVRQRALSVQAGTVDELCEVWDTTDRLVAVGTQLAQVRFAAT